MNLLNRICILVSLFCVGGLLAAELDPSLETNLKTADADHWFSVIVKLHNPRDIQALDQQLHVQKASRVDRHRIVMHALHLNAEETQGPVVARLQRMKTEGLVEGFTAFWIENLIVVSGKTDAILALASDPAVESIGYNFKASLIDPVMRGPLRGHHLGALDTETIPIGQRATGAVRVNRELGITGQGVLIAGLDTGVDGTHPALRDRWRGLTHPVAQCWLDLLGGSPNFPTDNGQHGTHTMGTMTGREIRTNGDTITVGAAPAAQWISCNAINQGVGRAFDQDILDAFQWLADPDQDSTTVDDVPDVVQNSWGVYANIGNDPTYTTCFNNWNTVILNCEAGGTVVIWSAGNEAAAGLRSPAKFQLSPTDMFSVGAVDLSVDSIAPYPIANFSSLGPSGCAPDVNAVKPEICAPGVNIFSSIPGGQYSDAWSGTSMAGPHISGIVALMREACPDCDPQTIKEALISTAVRTGYVTPPATENNTFGNGFIDAYAAVQSVFALGRVDGYVTTSGGAPVPGVTVQALNTTSHGTSGANGYYTVRTSQPGWYTLRFTKFGYQTVTPDSVQTVEGDTTHLNVTMNAVPQGVLLAHVMTQSGFPAVAARVQFMDTPLSPVIVDSTGFFVQPLPATSYTVHIAYVINLVPARGYTLDTTITVNAGDTTRITLPIYVDIEEPSNTDAYGYREYDRYDRALPCPYNWLNLDPTQGGGGTPFSYVNQDSATFFPAPFPLSFYGQIADSMTVNCNGWMLPGIHHETGKPDTLIPCQNPGGPPGIIAPFWNDVRTATDSRQYVRNDSLNGRWVFQFVNQHLIWPSNYSHNWEVQLLDPAFYPTSTGDFDILFLYGTMGWVTASTMGIENPGRTTGIQVRHDTTVAGWSWPVESGAAMRFTTGRATQIGHATVNLSLYPAPTSGTPLTLHVGGRALTSTYGATLGVDSVPAAPVSGVLTMTGYEAGRADHVVFPPNQNTNMAIEAWRLDPPRNVAGSQNNGVVVLSWNTPLSVQAHANPALRYSVVRDGRTLASGLTDTTFADQTLPNDSTVHYTVIANYRYGYAGAPFAVTIDLAARQPENSLPLAYSLYPNYPNPFNPDTRIRLDVPSTVTGKLQVYDLEGRLVKTLWSGSLSAGRYQYNWNSQDEQGRSVASGLYFCRFSSAQYTATQKMMLVK